MQVLYTASDYIHFTPGAVDEVCSGILDTFPDIDGMKNFEISIHDAPRLLKKESQVIKPVSINVILFCITVTCVLKRNWIRSAQKRADSKIH